MKPIVKILLATLAYGGGLILTGVLAPLLHIPAMPSMSDEPQSSERWLLITLATTPLFMASLLPLVGGLRGTWLKRWLGVSALLFVALGLNAAIELTIFSTHGSDSLYMAFYFVLQCFLAAAVMTAGRSAGAEAAFASFSAAGWAWRLAVAWLAFPVIYTVFGMGVAPFVVPYYEAGVGHLTLPPIEVIIRTAFVRSVLILAASLPAIVLWKKSRGQFIVAMGLAQAMAGGLFPMAAAEFMPAVVRVAHAIEITADSFAYAAVLGVLFVSARKRPQSEVNSASAPDPASLDSAHG